MGLSALYSSIISIIPTEKRKTFFGFLFKSILFGIIDLVSIAYLIPIIILLFDKKKFEQIAVKVPFLNQVLTSTSIVTFVMIFILCYVIKIVLQTKFNTAYYIFFYDLSTDLSVKNIDNFINESFVKNQNINAGKILQHVTNVPEDFSVRYLISIVNLIVELIVLFILIIGLLLLYFKITLLAIVILSVFAIFIFYAKQKQMTLINSIYLKTQAESNASLLNLINGYLEVKNTKNYIFFLNKYRKEKALLNNVTAKLVSYNSNYSKYLEIILIISIVAFSLFNYENQNIIVAVSVLGASSLRLIPSISRILNALTLIKSYRYSVDVLLKKQDTITEKTINIDFFEEIKLSSIHFCYEDNNIIENLNLVIHKGSFIGIMGESGIGKTTLLYIILGIIKPTKGNLYFDKNLISNYQFLSFANYVPQQPFLFNGTILENIVMGQNPKDIDFEYVKYLCKRLELDSVILQMKDQYSTVIIHDSLRLSGGQKQRLALARALYSKPTLLILDEATNQQDSVLAKKIYIFLNELKQNSKLTIVAISHNEDMNFYADIIYEVKDKKLIQI